MCVCVCARARVFVCACACVRVYISPGARTIGIMTKRLIFVFDIFEILGFRLSSKPAALT
jgi:hypothetical protein